jgi:amino acid permease
MYSLGIPLAIILQIGVMITTHIGSMMYLHTKDIVPGKPESLYEIGFMLYGRKSIFMLGSILFILAAGLCMIYFIVFGDTCGQFAATFTEGKESLGSVWYTSRWCYSVPLALILAPFCLKKELAELSFIALMLFVALLLFVIVNFIQLAFDHNFVALGISTDILTPKISIGTISALSVTCLAYSY